MDEPGVAVVTELKALEVRGDNLVEDPLPAAHHDQLPERPGNLTIQVLLGVVCWSAGQVRFLTHRRCT